jgi:hypothetical protein
MDEALGIGASILMEGRNFDDKGGKQSVVVGTRTWARRERLRR